MGPRLGGRGRPPTRESWPQSCAASMGPRLGGRGRSSRRSVVGVGLLASMGPRLGGRGRFDCTAEHALGFLASMGPRLGGRGRAPRRLWAAPSPSPASMGPRLGGRGRPARWAADRVSQDRFNGAAAWWPRKEAARVALPGVEYALQWGRGLVAAEGRTSAGSRCPAPGFNGAAAWWPRKVTSPRLREELSAASMGPRLGGRGRPSGQSPAVRCTGLLQWGRGLVAAEGRQRIPRLVAPSQLQWGRGLVAAEGGCGSELDPRLISFNGAAGWWPRKAGAIDPNPFTAL